MMNNMELNPNDFRIELINTGTTWFPKHTGVKVIHVPSGYHVTSISERSQHANHFKAHQLLAEVLHHMPEQLELF